MRRSSVRVIISEVIICEGIISEVIISEGDHHKVIISEVIISEVEGLLVHCEVILRWDHSG